MGTRAEVRSELVGLFAGDSAFNVVNGYAPLETKGATKILNIYSKRTSHEFTSKHLNTHFYTFILDFLAKRSDTSAAEDALDAAAEAIREVVRANVQNASWSNIQLEAETEAYFAIISGVPYRGEKHTVLVKVTGD